MSKQHKHEESKVKGGVERKYFYIRFHNRCFNFYSVYSVPNVAYSVHWFWD